VAASFVADDGKDPVPRDGTVIVSVSGRIGADVCQTLVNRFDW